MERAVWNFQRKDVSVKGGPLPNVPVYIIPEA